MRAVSAAFLSTITGSHTMAARARVCTTFQTGVNPTGTEIPIIGGSVTADATAKIRGRVDLVTDGTGEWPDESDDLLAPYGNELFIERGVAYNSGVIEYCSLGYFRIETSDQDSPVDGPIRITGRDRMAGIVDARLLAPAQFAASATYGDVMTQLVTEVYPSATIVWDDATDADTLGRALIVDEDRFAFLDDLVRSVGKIWYWDHLGRLTITTAPSTETPVWDVMAGAGGVLVSLHRSLTREGVYNAVVAAGEGADELAPARGVAVDANPNSPTYFSGPFGPVPMFYSSPFITTDDQAEAAAEALLRERLGLPYSVDFSAVPNPALEPYDPVQIRASTAPDAGVETHVIESVTVPLVVTGAMTATTREQTVVLIGPSP